MKAIVVDKDYGSVSVRELMEVQESYKQAGIELEAYHFQTEEEIMDTCRLKENARKR